MTEAAISVVMCTVDREALARACVQSVRLGERPPGVDVEVIVVDNSPHGAARSWAQDEAAAAGPPVRYVHEAERGISHARNAGVREAKGDFIAFIDDDETAAPDWLAQLYAVLKETGADMATGPVYPVFESPAPAGWDRNAFTARDRKVLDGAPLSTAPTANLLLRRDRCIAGDTPFDARLGLTGGEDTDFVLRNVRQGRRVVWASRAVVREFWPAEKSTFPAILKRKAQTSRNTAYVRVRHGGSRLGYAVLTMTIGAGQVAVFGAATLLGSVLQLKQRYRFAYKTASGFGRCTWWLRKSYY